MNRRSQKPRQTSPSAMRAPHDAVSHDVFHRDVATRGDATATPSAAPHDRGATMRRTSIVIDDRPCIEDYYLAMATLAASRSTCPRRQVGCVLVDKKNRVLAVGYNGAPPGFPHCIDVPCPGAGLPSGEGIDLCQAVHAEQSALVACRDVGAIDAVFCTTAPCVSCTKLLLSTDCRAIYFRSDYVTSGHAMWRDDMREWVYVPLT